MISLRGIRHIRRVRIPYGSRIGAIRGMKGLTSYNDLTEVPDDLLLPQTKNDIRASDPGLAKEYMNSELIFHEEYKKMIQNVEENLRPDVMPDENGLLITPEVKQLAEVVMSLNQIEGMMLTRLFQHHMGINDEEAKEFMMMGGGGAARAGAAGGGQEAAEKEVVEQTAFDVVLAGFDAKSKVKVIKEVRSITGLGLKDAKDMVEGVPKPLKKGVSKDEANELKEKLEGLGATVEVK